MIGKKILHYKIIEKLGEGGMGVVYLAEDTKLKRQVAIKFLPGHISANSDERKRFEIEAQAAAALNHPNIATIHAIEESDDQLFLVMEYIEGKELKQLTIDNYQLSIDYATQIAEGLKTAHEKGIVHRDIKSSNIMVTDDGKVKIMDFGLAKFRGSAQLTQVGTTLGTAAYMSPEQARGEEVDHRSDIWSLGVVLYEMLTGSLPFKGDYEQAVIYSIINEVQEPITGRRNDLPMELGRIVNKMLMKNSDERYQHLDELIVDLENLQKELESTGLKSQIKPGSFSKTKNKNFFSWLKVAVPVLLIALVIVFYFSIQKDTSNFENKLIVVLPFENLGAPEDEYFADGLTEEITSRLVSLSGLSVVSRSSSMQYKNTKKTIKEIGEDLNVTHVLDGTIRWEKRKDGTERLRVTPQLIRVSDDTHIWAERFDENYDKIFEVQTSIAKQIIEHLNIKLLGGEQKAIESIPTKNMAAYQAYLKGLEAFNMANKDEEDLKLSIDMFVRAIKLDSLFALAYARLSQTHSTLYFFNFDRSENRLSQAKEAFEKSLKLKPELPEAILAEGYYYYYGFRNYEKAMNVFRRAEKFIPNDSELLVSLAYIWRRQGFLDKAIAYQEKAMILNPKSTQMAFQLLLSYMDNRNYDQSIKLCEKIITSNPEFSVAYFSKAWCLVELGQLEESIIVMENMPGKEYPVWMIWRGYLDFLAGKYTDAFEKYSKIKDDFFISDKFILSTDFAKGESIEYLGNQEEAESFFKSALESIKKEFSENWDDHRVQSLLGIVNAKLGNKVKAIKHGKKAVELLPVSKDAMHGSVSVYWLALIYIETGEYEAAFDQLDYFLSIPFWMSLRSIQYHPRMKALRNHPRYKTLIEKHSEKQ